MEDCCRLLPWDSTHFGVPIARVSCARLTPDLLADIDVWSRSRSVRCLYWLSDADPGGMRLASEAGFRFIDVRTTVQAALPPETGPDHAVHAGSIRAAESRDLPELRKIAAESHRNTRFYCDGNFSRAACDEMYRIWIDRSCRESKFADVVFVAEKDGRIAGYISCKLDAGIALIGLVAVDRSCRGIRLGESLVRQASLWARSRGARHIEAVTQGANVPALRLYQKSGFLVSLVQFWYHRWLSPVAHDPGEMD